MFDWARNLIAEYKAIGEAIDQARAHVEPVKASITIHRAPEHHHLGEMLHQDDTAHEGW